MKRTKILLTLSSVLTFLILTSCSDLDIDGNENGESIKYNGVLYNSGYFYNADSDRVKLGKAQNGADVYSIGNTDPPNYILIVGSDNSGCFFAPGASVPTSGTITKALIDPGVRGNNSRVMSTNDELEILDELAHIDGELKQFTVDNYYTDGNSFYYVYNNSDVSCEENWGGYVAYTEGQWIFLSPDKGSIDERGEVNSVKVSAVVISDKDLIARMCKTDLTKYIEY